MFNRDFKTETRTKVNGFGWSEYEAPTWKGEKIALKDDVDRVEKKLNLILEHLELEYVEETVESKRVPAKLEKLKKIKIPKSYFRGFDFCIFADQIEDTKPKKKRGRPKKKK